MVHSWLLFSQWSCQQHTAEDLEWILSLSLLRDIPQVHPAVFWIFIFSLVKLGINMFIMCLLAVWTMWTRILISSCLFPLCLAKFRDIYVFRRLTCFLCSPSSNHIIYLRAFSFRRFSMSLQIHIMEFDATSLLMIIEICFPE